EKDTGLNMQFNGKSFIEGLKIVNKKDGNMDWVLTAKRADITEKGENVRLSAIEMTLADNGITIYADNGVYHPDSKNLTVDGRVTARMDDVSITTEDIELDSRAGIIKTENPVIVRGNNFSLRGRGIEIRNADQRVRILSNVKATFNN
ncbi:MAG: LPS export ABC transporter periplasmic protein LptC, partial [Nitrospirota bacterium]|nr:LPS export ABC transporter periplasmic protein LptC [Nitrospirota bacterium]